MLVEIGISTEFWTLNDAKVSVWDVKDLLLEKLFVEYDTNVDPWCIVEWCVEVCPCVVEIKEKGYVGFWIVE